MYKKIDGYDNYYINENGECYNSKTQKQLHGEIKLHGYKVYILSKNNIKTSYYAHRLVATYFLPNPLNLPIVNHIDGNKLNNQKSNLEWVSYSANTKHAHDNGLIKEVSKNRQYYVGDLIDETWVPLFGMSEYSVSNKGQFCNAANLSV